MPRPSVRRKTVPTFPRLAARFVAASSQNAQITDAAQTGLDPGTGSWSYELWINPDTLPAIGSLVGKGSTASVIGDAEGYWLFVQSNGSIRHIFGEPGSGTRVDRVSSAGLIVAGVWQHLIVNVDRAGSVTAFVNGTSNTFATAISAFSAMNVNSACSFRLGSATVASTDTAGSFFNGLLDCVRFRTRLLTSEEILRSYRGSFGLAYRELNPTEKVSLGGAWDLDGSLRGLHNSNHLTNNNEIRFSPGRR